MTKLPSDLTYRDVRMVLALLDNWARGAIHFSDGELVIDAVVGGAHPLRASAPADFGAHVVRAPSVGEFHQESSGLRKSGRRGIRVGAGTLIGVIRALGRSTPVTAGTSGHFVEFLADNGQFVEYGQPLAKILVRSE